jgi:hypothetical protein
MVQSTFRRTWFSFGLRTLLLFVVTIALCLALFVVPRENRRQAHNALVGRGINVRLEDDPNDPVPYLMDGRKPVLQPFWIRWWYGALPATYTRSVRKVWLNDKQPFSQADLYNIAKLGKIDYLIISRSIENPDWLRPLIQSDNIHGSINFWRCHAGSDILKQIGSLKNVKGLNFEDVPLNDKLMGHIAKLSQLEYLTLTRTGCGDSAMIHVAEFPRLRRLELNEPDVTDAGLKYLAKLSQLERFRAEVNAGDEGFQWLRKLSNLTELRLKNVPVTDRTLGYLSTATLLRGLELSSTNVDGSGMRYLRGCKQLDYIDLTGSPIKTGMASLAELPKLHFINLSKTQITDEELAQLGKSKSLVSLSLFDTQITDDGLKTLDAIPTLNSARTNSTAASRIFKGTRLQLKEESVPTVPTTTEP